MCLDNVHIGDIVTVETINNNFVFDKGIRKFEVVCEDALSFVINAGFGLCWFNRDDGYSYSGNSKIVIGETNEV